MTQEQFSKVSAIINERIKANNRINEQEFNGESSYINGVVEGLRQALLFIEVNNTMGKLDG